MVGRKIPGDNAEYDYRVFSEEKQKATKSMTDLEVLETADKLLKGDKEVVAAAGHARPVRSID